MEDNYDDLKYKVYFKDTGLLIATLDDEAQKDLRENKNLGIYKRALYENMVAEALYKSGVELYYYRNDRSTLELDFLIRPKNNIVPIEVKSNNGNPKSMKAVIENTAYPEITYGIKLANRNIGFNGSHYTFPSFLAFLVKEFLDRRK